MCPHHEEVATAEIEPQGTPPAHRGLEKEAPRRAEGEDRDTGVRDAPCDTVAGHREAVLAIAVPGEPDALWTASSASGSRSASVGMRLTGWPMASTLRRVRAAAASRRAAGRRGSRRRDGHGSWSARCARVASLGTRASTPQRAGGPQHSAPRYIAISANDRPTGDPRLRSRTYGTGGARPLHREPQPAAGELELGDPSRPELRTVSA